jgi:hypothetical protein
MNAAAAPPGLGAQRIASSRKITLKAAPALSFLAKSRAAD